MILELCRIFYVFKDFEYRILVFNFSKFSYFKINFTKQFFTFHFIKWSGLWKLFALGGIWTHDLLQHLNARPRGEFCGEILSRCFKISLGVVGPLPWGPCGLAVRRLPRCRRLWVQIPPRAKFFHKSPFYEVECEKLLS